MIRRRIEALEKKIGAVGLPGTCPRCGGPRPGVNMYVYAHKDGTLLFGACPECGLALDHTGKSLPAVHWAGPRCGRLCKKYGPRCYGIEI